MIETLGRIGCVLATVFLAVMSASAQAPYPNRSIASSCRSRRGPASTSWRARSARSSPTTEAAGRRRQPPGRERQHRHRGRGEVAARRLHAADDREHASSQPQPVQVDCPTIRSRISRRSARSRSGSLALVAHPSVPAKIGRGARRARQGEPGQAQLRARRATARRITSRWSSSSCDFSVDLVARSVQGNRGRGHDLLGGQVQVMFLPVHVALRTRRRASSLCSPPAAPSARP